jgi:periplasmic protein TonB
MFEQAAPRKRRAGWLLSAAVHAALFVVLLHRPAPIFVAPSSVVKGVPGTETVVYLAAPLGEASPELPAESKVIAPSTRRQRHAVAAQKPRPGRGADASAKPSSGGSPFGSLAEGPAVGADVRPALPVSFPDPEVDRFHLPDGVQGDVIVEITIDEQGAVIAERLLSGIGHGVDDKVIAALKNWRFRPATQDGLPIPSKQDVHFHFPG